MFYGTLYLGLYGYDNLLWLRSCKFLFSGLLCFLFPLNHLSFDWNNLIYGHEVLPVVFFGVFVYCIYMLDEIVVGIS